MRTRARCCWRPSFFVLPLFAFVSFAAAAPAAPHANGSVLEIVRIATGERAVVYRSEGRMESPVFSRDDRSLYFNRDGRIERFVLAPKQNPMVVDTGSARRCNNDHGISPDGERLVISDLTETGKSLMYVLPIEGGAPKRIAVPEPAYWHSWSPDGNTVAYCAARGGNYDIYTVSLDGGAETRLTNSPANDNGPDYSADGRSIYFHSDRTGSFQIWRMHQDGSAQEQVTHDEFENWFPHPSPDGKWIAVLSTKKRHETGHPPDANYMLRLLAVSGDAPPREIAAFFGGNGSLNVLCWSHDSSRIAFAVFVPSPVP